jgi:RNA polymerase II subunit A small phosphatase-like protein
MFHPHNAIPITSWFDDPKDSELLDLLPFLDELKKVDNVVKVLDTRLV